jgi:hypothetical protein
MDVQKESLEELAHIKNMMERSSRFVSLSGFSGIAAGVWALVGAYMAHGMISAYFQGYNRSGYDATAFQALKWNLILLASVIVTVTLITAFYFTWKRTKNSKLTLWNSSSRRLLINFCIPLITGGLLILGILRYDDWRFIAPLTLIFYGMALVNGSKYTLSDIRYLGIAEIILGLINTQYVGYGLYFWAAGFGLLHIVYGFIMWNKYERVRS